MSSSTGEMAAPSSSSSLETDEARALQFEKEMESNPSAIETSTSSSKPRLSAQPSTNATGRKSISSNTRKDVNKPSNSSHPNPISSTSALASSSSPTSTSTRSTSALNPSATAAPRRSSGRTSRDAKQTEPVASSSKRKAEDLDTDTDQRLNQVAGQTETEPEQPQAEGVEEEVVQEELPNRRRDLMRKAWSRFMTLVDTKVT